MNKRQRVGYLCGLLALVLAPRLAAATPLTPSLGGLAQACLGTFAPADACSIAGTQGPGPLVTTFSGSGDFLTVSADGEAAYGVLRASAEASFNITGPATNAFAGGGAGFIDILTISFAPWNGLPGLLNVDYTLDGTISHSGNGTGTARVVLFTGPNDSSFPTATREQDYNSSTSGVFSIGAPIPFTYGQPFVFDFSLFTCAGEGLLCNTSARSGVGTGDADFFNTMILSGLIPTDLTGDFAAGAQFSSASGTTYGLTGVAPEPTSLTLTALGLAGAIARYRRRRCRQAI